ncbi:TlpA disulfide reductase family protein [Pelagicoccus sp. SDUM812002]|uniref:TlpA family protein disulfide reductase n=1 Tax=Pelagicoccus sp. SDUM812002 TaxID=3041266 RepID=UPI00280EE974|nr:TlpA disulfide reductase family protein [Pelagicoccus sp. SDUM812002]MDQ8186423.1 TlpA disulfide reductase family protein [Pelagicoccus sp. SDUM812002]
MELFKITRSILAAAIVASSALTGFSATEEEHDALIALAKDKESDFATELPAAVDEGMSSDWILEAEIIRALSTGDANAMFDLIARIDAVGEDFRYGVGRDFYSAQQLAGFADVLRCVVAYREGDKEKFEKYAVSSYEKAPGFNGAFGIGELLANQRRDAVQEEAMADFRVPMDMVLANVEGESKSLTDWMGDDEVMLVDFWASWCGPCIRLMPSLKEKQENLSKQGVFVAGINTDRRDPLKNATSIREREGMESVPWLLDRNGGDLSGMLMVDSIPRMVLIDREGSVLYNGHPSDPSLGDALAKVGVELH